MDYRVIFPGFAVNATRNEWRAFIFSPGSTHEGTMCRVLEIMDGKPSIVQDKRGNTILLNDRKFVMLQSTGMIDKYHKMIFEGDVVRMIGHYRPNEIGLIEWRDGCFLVRFKDVDNQGTALDLLVSIHSQLAVVGTIFDKAMD